MMHRPINEQVIVITGASSGIGRETALECGKAGATVVISARNAEALDQVAFTITQLGGRVLTVPTDVTDWEQVRQLANTTINHFGRIDTWVNNAGISVYATAEETSVEETARIMQTNFMGVVHGVSVVLPHMKQQGHGTIINVGSVESQRAFPLQAAYAASKHAVKAYTEALRLEQIEEKTNIQITLILPSGINTPLFNHARSKVGVKPMPIPPVYSPELVARAIMTAAQAPHRDIYVGGAGFLFWLLERINPALLDKLMMVNKAAFRLQKTDEPDNGLDNLYTPMAGMGRVHGDFESLVKPSAYTPLFEFTPRWLRNGLVLSVPVSLIASLVLKRRMDAESH